MCVACAGAGDRLSLTSRPCLTSEEALAALALLENGGALARDKALSLAVALLDWSGSEASRFRCEAAEATASPPPDGLNEPRA